MVKKKVKKPGESDVVSVTSTSTGKTVYKDDGVVCRISKTTKDNDYTMTSSVVCKKQKIKHKTKPKDKKQETFEVKEPSYDHKYGHVFVKSLTAFVRLTGAIIWCSSFTECAHNISLPITHLALTGFVPADIILIVEFIVRDDRPYVLPLTHDVLGLILGTMALLILNRLGNCDFQTKTARFIPTSLLVCLLLHVFHVILFLAT